MSRLNTHLNTTTATFNTKNRTQSPSAITIRSVDWWGSTYKGGGRGK